MKASEAAIQSRRARDTLEKEKRLEARYRSQRHVVEIIEEGRRAIEEAVAEGQDHAIIDLFFVWENPKVRNKIKAPFVKDGYQVTYETGTGFNFDRNTTWTDHFFYVTWEGKNENR